MKELYDLIVIGAGPGGYVAAIKAAQLQKKVLIIENREVGGTCLNRGCIPTKTLIYATEVFTQLKDCERLGIQVEQVSYNMGAIHQRKDEVLNQLRLGIEGLLKSNKIDLIQGTGTILNDHTVGVCTQEYQAQNILIATGATPLIPPIVGIEDKTVITSDEILKTSDICYNKLAIIGAGVIGVEFATIYNALGCEVTIIEALDRILPTMDKEISQNLSMILKKRGVKIYTSAHVEKIEQVAGEPTCHFTVKEKIETVSAQAVLVSVGRSANTNGLLGEGVDLQLDRGKIPVNETFQTCISNIYAIGDVIKGGIQLAHVASAQGINAVSVMFGEE
ncbi:MAG: FAD-dependent oxidoreductase, partial [Oscillospiraceae bacterium]